MFPSGKCDEVMAAVMKALGYELPYYSRIDDPIFTLATSLHDAEAGTTSRPSLVPPIPQPPGEEAEEEAAKKEEEQKDLDVRWEKEEADSGKEADEETKTKKRKLENFDSDVKEEKDFIKEECKDSVKPLNGVSTNWLPILKDEKDVEVKTENPSGDGNHIMKACDEIKSEHDVTNCIKEEEKVLNKLEEEDKCTNFERKSNGLSIPSELSQLYTALTTESRKPEDGFPEEEQLISADEEEEKSESPDSDEEDYQVSDMEGEAWPSDRLPEPWDDNNKPEDNTMADKDAHSSKSTDTCCSDFESEKEEDCQVEDSQAEESQVDECQTEDSQVGDDEMDDCNVSSPESVNQVNYMRLAYSTTKERMAKQGQTLLKQNDFYGTGLCIRSFIDYPKPESTNEETIVNEAQEPEHNSSMELDSAAEQTETDNTSLPSHNKCSTIGLSSSSTCSGEVLQNECDDPESVEMKSRENVEQGTVIDTNCVNSIENTTDQCDNVESDEPVTERDGTGNENKEKTPETQDKITESPGAALLSLPVDSVNTIINFGNAKNVNDIAKMDYMLHHLNQDLTQGSSQDGSFLLRTHIVDGVIRRACVETLSKGNSDKGEVTLDANKLPNNVPSISELAKLSIPCLRIQRALLPTPTNLAICKQDNLSGVQLQNVVSHCNQRRNYESKFTSQLNASESEELKSIWYQSFCGPNSESGLGTLAAMVGVKECNLSKTLGNSITCHRPHGSSSNPFPSPENSSSVILKNICAETVSDSVAKQKGSAKKKPKGCDNEDVKYIWFWGFDSNMEQKQLEKGDDSDDSDSFPTRRVTRSRTRASCDSQQVAQVEMVPEEFVCHCSGKNPELCQVRKLRSPFPRCDDDVQKARDIINRRRTYNYRRYEPVFEKEMESITYERIKPKRKAKFETGNNNEVDEEFEEQEQENTEMKEEEKASDGEDGMRERDEKGERKITPGWYGKGLRKGMKKKTRV